MTEILTPGLFRRVDPFRSCTGFAGAALIGIMIAACERAGAPPSDLPHAAGTRPVVLYVEEPRFAESAQHALDKIIQHFNALAPDEHPDWRLITSDPGYDDKLKLAVADMHPSLVVLANDGLLDGIGDWANDTNFLIPSELSPAGVQAQLDVTRSHRRMAFVSWNSGAYERTVDHLRTPCGAPVRDVAAFFPSVVIDAGDREAFLTAAKRSGLRVTPVLYDSFDDFQRRFDDIVHRQKPDALYLPISPDLYQFPEKVADLVAAARIPAVYSRRDQVWNGGLIATDGADEEVEQNLARYALLILHGADPSTLQVSRPSQLETTVNLRAAAAIGCVVPYEVLVESQRIVGR